MPPYAVCIAYRELSNGGPALKVIQCLVTGLRKSIISPMLELDMTKRKKQAFHSCVIVYWGGIACELLIQMIY